MGVELILLCYAGVAAGAFAVCYGMVAVLRGSVPLTRKKRLTGAAAFIAGGVCVAAGVGLIALVFHYAPAVIR
jgi:hypothetical protein